MIINKKKHGQMAAVTRSPERQSALMSKITNDGPAQDAQ